MHIPQLVCFASLPPPESNVKSVDEKNAEAATTSAPSKPQNEDPRRVVGEVNGFSSPSEETTSDPQLSVPQSGTAAPPNTPAEEPATVTQAPLDRPVQLQDGHHPETPAALGSDETPPQPGGQVPPSLSTNGLSLDSTDAGVLSPSSLSDSEPAEDVVGCSSSLVSEKATPEESGNVTQESSSDADSNAKRSSTTEDKDERSFLSEVVGQNTSEDGECVIVRMCEEGLSGKRSETKVSAVQFDEGITKCDVQDEPEDVPSASEAMPPPLKLEPKKSLKLFKRNKKSNQGNLNIHSNKGCFWNNKLLSAKGKPVFFLILLQLIYIMYCLFWIL